VKFLLCDYLCSFPSSFLAMKKGPSKKESLNSVTIFIISGAVGIIEKNFQPSAHFSHLGSHTINFIDALNKQNAFTFIINMDLLVYAITNSLNLFTFY
jgi:hypothetical protein